MIYQISYSEEARRAIPKLPGRYRQRVRRLIEALAVDPRSHKAKELRGLPGVYRIWMNGWRVIYQVDDEAGRLLIIGVRKKKGPETYENLEIGE